MPEKFECRNCLHCGPLDVHGYCEHCGSSSVISVEVLSLRGRAELNLLEDLALVFSIPPHMIGAA